MMPRVPRRMVRFGIVGLSTNVVDFGCFSLAHAAAGLGATASHVISYTIAAIFSFLCHKFWTFVQLQPPSGAGLQGLRFALVNVVGLTLSSLLVAALARPIGAWGAKITAMILLSIFFYNAMRLAVFGGQARGSEKLVQPLHGQGGDEV